MKSKIILLVLLLVANVALFDGGILKADDTNTNKLPSTSSYENEVSYLNNSSQSTKFGSLTRSVDMVYNLGDDFGDAGFGGPGDGSSGAEGGGTGGSVPAPLGNVTPVVILVMLMLYVLFNRATASRRRNL